MFILAQLDTFLFLYVQIVCIYIRFPDPCRDSTARWTKIKALFIGQFQTKRSFVYASKKPKNSSWFDVKTHGLEPHELFVKDKLAKSLSELSTVFSFWLQFLAKVMSTTFVKDYKFGSAIFFKEYHGVGMTSRPCLNPLKWIGVHVNTSTGMTSVLTSYCK